MAFASLSARRAWIEITAHTAKNTSIAGSLSARRAWIEILLVYLALIRYLSLSARRAWIEIAVLELIPLTDPVALRKESVDRNSVLLNRFGSSSSRSPQGERG